MQEEIKVNRRPSGPPLPWQRYLELEAAVQRPMVAFCGEACASCATPCCRPVFCREAVDSPALRELAARLRSPAFAPDHGFLGPSGCTLAGGRPPVCYEFLCREIQQRLDPRRRKAALALGRILTEVGRRAVGDHHLIELEPEALASVDPARLEHEIDQGFRTLERCREQLEGR